MAEAPFTPFARTDEVPAGGGLTREIGGRLVAVFNDGGRFFAIDDICPHMGASLGGGPVSDGAVTCPWHAWRFRLSDGGWCDDPSLKVDVFELRVVDGVIEIRIPAAGWGGSGDRD